ncbi:MAG: DUF4097 family beta strand repeat protein [Saprospiraceae bacterium]|nr:DUF4097 family beta strand repeat protein [Saprospiraceae bacterium]MCB0623739.1 DUF4097 family beta strand repeat protein [Saprospiraceae bacterium]MCB0684355.1 DUF4097 family beta strand repeat protein [Saprospiraceae bacterium]
MNKLSNCWMTLLLLCAADFAIAQSTPMQVVTRTVEKTLPYRSGSEVNIEGEKAEIVVETWDRNEVKIVLELVAKHPDRAVAERDVKSIKFSIDQHGDMIYFRNYISPDEGQPKPESTLKAIYTVTLPDECPLYLKNYFGLANVSNLSRFLRLRTEFSNVFLQNLSGDIGLTTRFGDLNAQGLSGTVSIDARRSDITLHDISGDFDIRSTYGIIKLFTDESLVNLNIEAEKSDVYFFDPKPGIYGYTLTAHYGNISVPNDLKFNFLENSSATKRWKFSPTKEMATISIKISFGDIVIRNP